MIKRNPRIIKRNIEIWKSIKGYPGYQVSCLGRIQSIDRIVPDTRTGSRFLKNRILKADKYGPYDLTTLAKNKKSHKFTTHSLVINHFGPPKPSPKHECNHIDGIKSNNGTTNLEWMTPQENTQHSFDLGLNNGRKGEKNNNSKVTVKQVKKIRKLYSTGKFYQKVLGELFGISQTSINSIVKLKTWADHF
jgi:predicted XRE-type DNA-binding protein